MSCLVMLQYNALLLVVHDVILPIVIVVDCRVSSSGGVVPYSTLHLVSLRGEEENGANVVRRFNFKTRPVMDVHCNRRYACIIL